MKPYRNIWMRGASFILLLLLVGSVFSKNFQGVEAHPADRLAPFSANSGFNIYLPSLFNPRTLNLGVEPGVTINNTLFTKIKGLNGRYIRLNNRISWRLMQPDETDPIDWTKLATFEQELKLVTSAGLTPVVIVDDYPRWTTIYPSGCAPLAPDRYDDFAEFIRQLVLRYKDLGAHNWEIGNEIDIQWTLVGTDSVFGCWGDWDDVNYGGAAYGQMLKIISPVIRSNDPGATIWLGGLLLERPNTTWDHIGKPENFLRGVLSADPTGSSFDIVPFHWYNIYWASTERVDYDTLLYTPWGSLGGGTIGKANYIRQLMAEYGVNKPVVMNETALGCREDRPECNPPGPGFYQAQVDWLLHSYPRAMSIGLAGYFWYTIDAPGWRYTGMVNHDGTVTPIYNAAKVLSRQLDYATYSGTVDYGLDIEAYSFSQNGQQVQLVWTKADRNLNIQVPKEKFISANAWDGNSISPTDLGNGNYQVPVSLTPIYLHTK